MISNKTYELIGKLSFEFNRLQFFSAYLFNSFGKSTKSGFKIMEKYSFRKFLKKIRSYIDCSSFNDDEKCSLKDLIDNADKCRDERNKFVHSLLMNSIEDNNEKAVLFFESIREQKTVLKDINHNEIEELIKETRNIGIQIIYATINVSSKLRSNKGV